MKRDTGKHRLTPADPKDHAAIMDIDNAQLDTPIGGEYAGQVVRERYDRWNPKQKPRSWRDR